MEKKKRSACENIFELFSSVSKTEILNNLLFYLSTVCESHLSVFVPSNYTEKGLKAGPVVGMKIYMHPRIIVMKGRRKDSDEV